MAPILDAATAPGELAVVFAEVDAALTAREAAIARGEALPLTGTIDAAITLVQRLMTAYVATGGQKAPPGADADFL